MHTVIVSRGRFPGYDGPARRVKYLGAGLAGNGCDVALVVSYPPNPVPCGPEFETAYGYRYMHTMTSRMTDSTGILRKLYYKIRGTLNVYSSVGTIHAAKRVDAMLICGVGFVELLVAWCTARRFGIVLAVDKNDVNYRLKSQSRVGVYGLLSGINIALSDLLMTSCVDVIFTVNRHLHDLYSGRTAARVRYIIPSFVDRRELDSPEHSEDIDALFDHFDGFRFLSVVTTPPHSYGFVPFAEALGLLKSRYRFRLYLLCSKDKETLRRVHQLLTAHGLQLLTTVLTEIAPEVVQSVYAGADIILNAQQEPAIAEGGFPGKTAEILASRRPVVSTLFSDVHKYYVDGVNCLVVNYDDLNSYLTAITALCDSADLRERIGREGRKTALGAFEYIAGTGPLKDDLAQAVNDSRAVRERRYRHEPRLH